MAVLSAVAMSNVTPPAGAGMLSETVKVKVVPPEVPSAWETSLMERRGVELPPQGLTEVTVLRGVGRAAVKSARLLPVSVQPAVLRMTALVLEGAAEGAVSEQLAVEPKPRKSTTPAVGQAPVRAVVEVTRATLPAVADMAMVPVASGVGRLVVPPAPCASWMRRYWPGRRETLGRLVTCQEVPAADAYWTDMPLTLAAEGPALKTSMKSFRKVEPALPPPP